MTLNNLAIIYQNRIRGERADNLEQAIHHHEEALTVRTREAFPEDWAASQNNLATAYSERIQGEGADNLERAIQHYEEALTVRTREAFPKDWALTHNNLGTAYWNRIRGERADNLEQAIQHYEEALTVRTRKSFPEDWALTHNNLATAYWNRIRGERADNLEQAIHHYEQALKVRTREAFPEGWAATQNNLGTAYRDRIRGQQSDNQEQAIHCYHAALTVYTREAFPNQHRKTQRNLGNLQFEKWDWVLAHAAYAAAIEAGADVLAQAYTETARRAEVGETSRLYAADAYCLLRLRRPHEALATLEAGKTRLLNEALALVEVDLLLLQDGDQTAIRQARQAISELEAEVRLPPDTPARRNDRKLADELRRARADLNRLVKTIRAVRPEFLPVGLKLSELLALIPEGGALAAPLLTSKGGAVFVVPHAAGAVGERNVLWLDNFSDGDLRALLDGWFRAYLDDLAAQEPSGPGSRWHEAIEGTLSAVWDRLMGPVDARLRELGLQSGAPVLLLPQAGLGLLPLHAAWREVEGKRRYFLDDWTVSYAPSGYALAVGRERLGEPQRSLRSLLAAVNPTRDLMFSAAEAEAVMGLFGEAERESLPEAKATLEAVTREAKGRAYLHFSCHGEYNWRDPMRSGLRLAGGETLSLADAIAPGFDLNSSRLVVLSACETGLTDIRQSPDEYLGLPAGFLQAGAPAVISSLWAVDDLSTTLLMERLYRGHLEEKLTPAAALRRAQIWLRGATIKDLDLAERWAKVYRTTTDPDVRKRAFAAMRYFARHPEERPFSSPFYWAPFTFSGA